jgi:hypothetical protein
MSERGWPSLEEQLREYDVAHDSPLGRLIQENQDFELLQPDELDDQIPLPLWLRIHWRNQHPDLSYSADYPMGGYPRALTYLLEWMLTHPDLEPEPEPEPFHDPPPSSAPESQPPPSVSDTSSGGLGAQPPSSPAGGATTLGAPSTVLAAPPAPAVAALLATIGSNRRISGAQVTPRAESDIRVNFFQPKRIIAASVGYVGQSRQAQFYSLNWGTTWGNTTLPLALTDSRQGDPAVDWTSDGTAWAMTLGITAVPPTVGVRAYRSTDGGKTWSFDATVSGAQTATDKELMWTDHSARSPFRNNIYVIWNNGQAVFVNRRTGPTGAWQAPIQVSGAETGFGIAGDITTNGSGDVFAMWTDTVSRNLFVSRSFDGGVTFSSPVAIATTFASFDIGVPADAVRKALIYLSAGAYETSTRDFVYAIWTDLTGGAGCNASANEPGNNVSSACKTRIWFSRSAPKHGSAGRTWKPPFMINNHPTLSDQFNPRLAVDPTDGTIGVIYYDTVRDPGRLKTDVWFQSSSDQGASWSKPVRVTTAQTDETSIGAFSAFQYGDYNGLSGYAGRFWPSWTDRRNGAREEIWTAAIRIEDDDDDD